MEIIDTRDKLKRYIVETLGEPIITVEITEKQMDNIIDDVITTASLYFHNIGVKKHIILPLRKGITEYKLPKHTMNVLKVKSISSTLGAGLLSFDMGGGLVATQHEIIKGISGGNTDLDITAYLVLKSKLSYINKFFTTPINYNWNEFNKTLTFLDNTPTQAKKVLIVTNQRYVPDDCGDDIFNHPWIKAMSTARSKLQWGTNIGKVSGGILGGVTLNYDRIISEAKEEIAVLDQQLLTRNTPPPVLKSW